jgi:hypothetical protein
MVMAKRSSVRNALPITENNANPFHLGPVPGCSYEGDARETVIRHLNNNMSEKAHKLNVPLAKDEDGNKIGLTTNDKYELRVNQLKVVREKFGDEVGGEFFFGCFSEEFLAARNHDERIAGLKSGTSKGRRASAGTKKSQPAPRKAAKQSTSTTTDITATGSGPGSGFSTELHTQLLAYCKQLQKSPKTFKAEELVELLPGSERLERFFKKEASTLNKASVEMQGKWVADCLNKWLVKFPAAERGLVEQLIRDMHEFAAVPRQ